MAKSRKETRKAFVQARLAATGKEATPEQLAKFRQRFQTLTQTAEGRTRIAQVVLPGGTASERKTFKQSLRPTKTGSTETGSTETGSAETGPTKISSSGYVPGYFGVSKNSGNRTTEYSLEQIRNKNLVSSTSYQPQPTGKYSNLFIAGKSPVPKEGFGLPGKTYVAPSNAVKTLSLPQPKTPVVRDSGSSLRGMQGQGGFDPSTKNVVRAALAASSVAALSKGISVAPSVVRSMKEEAIREKTWSQIIEAQNKLSKSLKEEAIRKKTWSQIIKAQNKLSVNKK